MFEGADRAGLFGPDSLVELLDGEVYPLVPVNPPHADVTGAVEDLLRAAADLARFTVHSQSPVVLGEVDEPQPDVWLASGPSRPTYQQRHPGPADLLLVVEVGDSSLEDDRRLKIPRYAVAGVPLVWLVDVRHRLVEVSAAPLPGERRYTEVTTLRADDRLRVVAADVDVRADDLFPALV